jgi:hypothetical protein
MNWLVLSKSMFIGFSFRKSPYTRQIKSAMNKYTYTNAYIHADLHRPTNSYMRMYVYEYVYASIYP